MIIGFLLSFGTALAEALKDIFSKKNLFHIDEYVASFSMYLAISVLLLPIVAFSGLPEFSSRFVTALLVCSILQLAVILLYMKAIKRAELSTTVPLVSLSPLFMLITSPVLIGEFPEAAGLAGIVLIVTGTYILNRGDNTKNFWAPFKSIITNQSSRYMLMVAFIWSITANIDKVGVEETSPIFWAFSKGLLIMAYLFPILLTKSPHPLKQLRSRALPLSMVGTLRAASVVMQMVAIQYILVAYVIAVKRSSALLIVLYAVFIMGNKSHFKSRILGIVIITTGLILIAFS